MNDPELTNVRAEREWLYLCNLVGEERARAAIGKLPGSRKPFPLNIAKVLGVTLPPEDLLPVITIDRQVARSEIDAMRALLGKSRKD